jgi:hypothetical protein
MHGSPSGANSLDRQSSHASAKAVNSARGGIRSPRIRKRLCYVKPMVKTFEQAIAEVSNLPETDQEEIGRKLLSHIEKLRQLRAEIDKGIRSLDAGEGSPLDIEDFIRQANERRAKP